MSNPQQQAGKPDSMGAFFKGASSGFVNGAIMTAIVVPLGLVLGSLVSPLVGGAAAWIAIAKMATMLIGATTLFGGIASMRKEHKEAKQEVNEGRAPTRTREAESPTLVPVVMADRTESPDQSQESTAWRSRFEASRSGTRSYADALQERRAAEAERAASLG